MLAGPYMHFLAQAGLFANDNSLSLNLVNPYSALKTTVKKKKGSYTSSTTLASRNMCWRLSVVPWLLSCLCHSSQTTMCFKAQTSDLVGAKGLGSKRLVSWFSVCLYFLPLTALESLHLFYCSLWKSWTLNKFIKKGEAGGWWIQGQSRLHSDILASEREGERKRGEGEKKELGEGGTQKWVGCDKGNS